MGGFDGEKITDKVWKFDPHTFKLEEMPSMNQARANFTLELSHNCQFIYAIGGFNYECGPLNSVERLDLVTFEWSMVTPMSLARYNHASSISLSKM